MSADYDRLFHSPDAVRTADEEIEHDAPPAGRDTASPHVAAPRSDATPPPMPIAQPRTQAAAAPPPRQSEITSQIPATQTTGPQHVPNNGMMRAPQTSAQQGARHEQQRPATAPGPRHAPAPAPSAFTLFLFAIVLISTGQTDKTWVSQLSAMLDTRLVDPGAHPYLFLFLVGLVAQFLFQVTLVTLASAGMLFLLSSVYGEGIGKYFYAPAGGADAYVTTDGQLEAIERPIVQVGFGGLGLTLDPALFAQWPEHWFVMAAPSDPSLAKGLRRVANLTLLPSGVRPIDVFPHCERHLGKPGFSTFCEALSLGVGLHVVQRRDFAEVDALMHGLALHGHHRLISRHQLNRGDWQLDLPLLAPQGSALSAEGARQAAGHLIAVAEQYQ